MLVRIEKKMGKGLQIIEVRQVHRNTRQTGQFDLGVLRNSIRTEAHLGSMTGHTADAVIDLSTRLNITLFIRRDLIL